jgi:hypothetical protein
MTCDQCYRPINYCFYIPDEFWLKTAGTREGYKCAHCVLEQLGGLDWLIIWNEPAEKMRLNSKAIDDSQLKATEKVED